jgi:predicted GIY-YIG superfamily endonuclease
MTQHHILYRMFGRGRRLLYVGITMNVEGRFHAHRRDKPWWRQVQRMTLEHFDTRAEAEAAERSAIKTEQPKYNIVHRTRLALPPPVPAAVPPATGRRGRPATGHTPVRAFRMSDRRWDKMGAVAAEEGLTRAELLERALHAEERRMLRAKRRAEIER